MLLRLVIPFLALGSVGAAAQTFQPGRLPISSRDSFEIVGQGQPMGTLVISLAKSGETFTLVGDMRVTSIGAQQLDTVIFDAATLAPTTLSHTQSVRGMSTGGRILVVAGKATGKIERPGAGGVPQAVDISTPMAAGVLADGMETVLIPTMDLREGITASFQFFDPNNGMIKPYTLKVVGRESVTVPAGTFDAWKVEFTTDQVVTMWISAEDPRKLVLIALDGGRMQIRRLK
jgi:hypothetical protein